MTIQAAVSEKAYAGDGVSTVFQIPFPFDTAADLKLTSTDASGNILTLSTGFTISGGAGSTGNAIFSVAPIPGVTITICDNPALTQPTDYVSLDAFPAESHERALDRVTRIAKRLYQLVQRSVRFPDGDVSTDGVLGSVANRKGKYLFFNAVTGAIEYAANIVTTTLSQSVIGQLLFPQTPAEIAAPVAPTNLAYSPWRGEDVRRIGAIGNGVADDRGALNTANSIGAPLYFPPGTYLINSNLALSVPIALDYGAKLKPASGVTLTVSADVTAGAWQVFDLSAGGAVTGLKRSTPHWFGAAGDGSTDDSTAIQRTVDSTKGGLVTLLEGYNYLAAGILLSGSTYNNTKIVGRGKFTLKASGGTNFGGAWVGIILQSCDNVTVDLFDSDGNRTNQPQNEHIFILGIAGASNYKIPNLFAREIRGDALYIGQSTWGSSSTNPTDGRIGSVHVVNSADDGRNAVSIIAAVGLTIDSIYSMKVGGTVNSVLEPGGLDIEPDAGYETVQNVVIGTVNVTTAGTGGCQIFGKSISGVDANKDWNISDVVISSATLQKTGTSGGGLNGNNIFRCKDVRIDGSMYFATAVYGGGWIVDFADRIYGKLKARTVSNGITLGFSGSLNDFELECHVTDYSVAGVKTTLVTNGTLRGRVYGAKAASTSFAVQCHNNARGAITQTDVIYSINAPYDGVNVRAFRNEPGNLVTHGAGTVCRDCDWSGYASFTVCFDTSLPKINILGVNYGTVQPANGAWQQGDVVENTTPSLAAGKVTTGWTRLTTGTANVANTDWAAQVVPNS